MQKFYFNDNLFTDITGKIIKCCLNVHGFIGNGFNEEIYHQSLIKELKWSGLKYASKQEISVYYKDDEIVGTFYPDFIVEGKVIVELKAVEALCGEHVSQCLNYLKATGMGVALLINFGSGSMEIKRLLNKNYNPQIKQIEQKVCIK